MAFGAAHFFQTLDSFLPGARWNPIKRIRTLIVKPFFAFARMVLALVYLRRLLLDGCSDRCFFLLSGRGRLLLSEGRHSEQQTCYECKRAVTPQKNTATGLLRRGPPERRAGKSNNFYTYAGVHLSIHEYWKVGKQHALIAEY